MARPVSVERGRAKGGEGTRPVRGEKEGGTDLWGKNGARQVLLPTNSGSQALSGKKGPTSKNGGKQGGTRLRRKIPKKSLCVIDGRPGKRTIGEDIYRRVGDVRIMRAKG